jgi:hypothetical protein
MPEFIIHVGPHKTGTTYLQLSFKAARPVMAARGIIYPDVWDYAPGNPSHLPLALHLKAGETARLAPEFDRLLASGAERVLLSAEDLSNLDVPALEILRGLIGQNPVRVVFYFRRWSELLPSSWQESVKQGQTWTLPEYMLMTIHNVAQSRLLNFERKLAPFAQVFGADALHPVSYSEVRDRDMDIFVHFAAQFLDWPSAVPGGAPKESNASRDPATTEILRMMNVLSRRHGTPERLRQKFDRLADPATLAPVTAAIAAHMQKQRFNDGWPALHDLHESLAALYLDRLVPPKRKRHLFSGKAKDLAYAAQDYLLEPGVIEILSGLHAQLRAA